MPQNWRPLLSIGFVVAALSGLGGCAGLKLQLVDASVRRPSNVAVYFTVDTRGGEPVADLTPADFHIYEDGEPVSVLEGVKALHHQMESAPVPLRFGTLVVFTDGTDRAHRVAPEEVTRALDSAGFETYVIGVGQEVDRGQLSRIGRSGTFASRNRSYVQRGFDEVGARIEASSKRYYLLSYCSPSRAGQHQVEIEAVAHGSSGRLSHPFNATGFGPTCDPNQRPAFDVHHPRSMPPTAAAPPVAETRPPAPSSPPPSSSGPNWQPKR